MEIKRQQVFIACLLVSALVIQVLTNWGASIAAPSSPSDGSIAPIPFSQNWSNTSLISSDDNWLDIPGIMGYRGDDLTTSIGADPQTILTEGITTPIDLIANQTDPNLTTGGVAEFEIDDPVVALQGSDTADAPFLLISFHTIGYNNIQVSYNLRDIDGSSDNAVQPVALQYRVGGGDNFINLPAGFAADATTGPSLANLVTPVSVTLPAAAENRDFVQVRVITTNAIGNDEWVGIDDISITGTLHVGDWAPSVLGTWPHDGAANIDVNENVSVGFSEYVNVTGNWFSINCSKTGNHQATVNGGPDGYYLDPIIDFSPNETCTVTIYAAQVSDQDSDDPPDTMATNYVFAYTTVPGEDQNFCGAPYTPIYTIQGSGETGTPYNTIISTEGVVTGDFMGEDKLLGFFIQSPNGDGDPATSDGIFVYALPDTPGYSDVNPGDYVRVKGGAGEVDGRTQIGAQAMWICSSGHSIAPTTLNLPVPVGSTMEQYENMLVVLPQTLTNTDNYLLAVNGHVTLSADGRLYEPTNDQGGTQELNNQRKLFLDDGSNTVYPPVIPYLAGDNTLRLGDTINNLTGVLTYGVVYGTYGYKLQPTIAPMFVRSNPRQSAPQNLGGTLRVASMNVFNYFNGDGLGGGFSNSRGAISLQEFERQRTKLIQAILILNADIVGLMEIENDGDGPLSAIQDLVNGLNAATAPGTYVFINEPAPGTDQIKVAMIYKQAKVTPVGAAQNYQTNTTTYSPLFERPPLAQLFKETASGNRLAVVISHFKSKYGEVCPEGGADANQGDGQGCWNAKRVAQAKGLLSFVESLKASDPDVLVIGDLNAYGQEDPVDTLTASGLVNEIASHVPLASRYSYVFDGKAGYLDHALATSSLNGQVKGVSIWHINADEPQFLDFKKEFMIPDIYNPDEFRSSDHDPVIVGLELGESIVGNREIFIPMIRQP